MISLQLLDYSCWVFGQVEELMEQQRKFSGTRKPSSRLRCSSTLESRDARMPATSGARKQLLAFLLEHYPGLMLILLDSWTKEDDVETASRCPVIDFVHSIDDLLCT